MVALTAWGPGAEEPAVQGPVRGERAERSGDGATIPLPLDSRVRLTFMRGKFGSGYGLARGRTDLLVLMEVGPRDLRHGENKTVIAAPYVHTSACSCVSGPTCTHWPQGH